ncbi:hypothetical protein ACLOAV_004505 [Pseudogymnoascus australis]
MNLLIAAILFAGALAAPHPEAVTQADQPNCTSYIPGSTLNCCKSVKTYVSYGSCYSSSLDSCPPSVGNLRCCTRDIPGFGRICGPAGLS